MVVKMDIVLPKQLENLQPWTLELPQQQYSWLSNEDIARIMICFQKHEDWLTDSRVHRYVCFYYFGYLIIVSSCNIFLRK